MSLSVYFAWGSLALAQAFDSSFGSPAPVTPAEYDARLERGVELYASGEFADAETYFRNLTRTAPDRKEAHLWLGQALRERGLRDEARESFQRYSELAPEDVEGFYETGASYEVAGNPALAKLWYKKAQDVDPQNEKVRQALSRIDGGTPASETADASSQGAQAATTPGATAGSPVASYEVVPPTGSSAAPNSTDPDATAPDVDAANDPADERHPFVQFWYEGIAGVTGARTVWWGRAIVIVFMILGAIGSGQNLVRFKEKFPAFSDGYLAFSSALGAAFTYVLCWGVPDGWNWAWLGGYVLLTVVVALGTLQSASQASRA